MKNQLATVLAVSVMLSLAACKGGGNGNGGDDGTVFTTQTLSMDELPKFDLSTLPPVDTTETFDDYKVGHVDQAWGADKDLRMAYTSVRNYFCYYSLDYNNNQINTNLNYVSTVSRPNVTVYPAEKDGYVVYEVKYSQIFPICTREPSNVSKAFFSYHGVGFIDYYTGTTYPVINLSTQINSFCVTGNVIYEGKKYNVSYYEYRSTEWKDGNTVSNEDGTITMSETVQIDSTSYFVVPEGYDGIIMCVYVANDTDKPLADVLAEDNPYFEAPGLFGDDENTDDYVFFGITAPK